jgi:hypothetical protein
MVHLHRGLIGVAATAAILLSGCNATELEQIASELQANAPAAQPSSNPSPAASAVPSGSFANGSTCTYTVSLTYDLGPGIDVTQSFEVVGSGRHGIEVTEAVLQVNATGCPENSILPAAGDSQQGSAYAITSENGVLKLFSTPFSEPTLFSVSAPLGSLVTPDQLNLSMNPAQISNGHETQIFDNGVLQSAQGESDALMIIQVTYVYAESGSQGGLGL